MQVAIHVRGICILFLLATAVIGRPSFAQGTGTFPPPVGSASVTVARCDPWRNSFTLYLWVPAVYGDLAVRGRHAHISSSIGDTWHNLSNLTNVFTGHYEGGNSRFTLILDALYTRLRNQANVGPIQVTIRPKQTIAEIDGAFTVDRHSYGPGRYSDIQALVGARYTSLGLSLQSANGVIDVSGRKSWVDPFIGARYRQALSPRWSYSLRGDIGGFGISQGSKFTWNAVVAITDNLSKVWALDAGWRWLKYDYDQGSGSDEFEYDVMNSGPFMGVTLKF